MQWWRADALRVVGLEGERDGLHAGSRAGMFGRSVLPALMGRHPIRCAWPPSHAVCWATMHAPPPYQTVMPSCCLPLHPQRLLVGRATRPASRQP